MRLSDKLLNSVVFLCVRKGSEDRAKLKVAATGFIVGVESSVIRGAAKIYLVTAKHNIENAKAYDAFVVRVNPLVGDVREVELKDEWYTHSDPGSDAALLPLDWPAGEVDVAYIARERAATPELIERHNIGIGDEVAIVGLFSEHYGQK